MKAVMNLLLAAVVGSLVVIGVFSFSIAYQSHAVTKGIQERNIVGSVNQMEFIKIGMEQGALYSVYQAGYNVSKYGTYKYGPYGIFGKCDTAVIDQTLLDAIPKDLLDLLFWRTLPYWQTLPYWRIFGTPCFDATTIPSEIENDVIKPWFEGEISDRFNEYIGAIKNEYEIIIPTYTPTAKILKDGEMIFAEMSVVPPPDVCPPDCTPDGCGTGGCTSPLLPRPCACLGVGIICSSDSSCAVPSDEIRFEGEKLKLSKPSKITKIIKLPLKRLIDYSINNYIKLADPFAEEIKKADQAMAEVTVQNRVDADPGSVKPEFVNNDLNDGELTDRLLKSCKSTEFEICINPEITPDSTYTYPTKSELLPTNCESEFKTKVNEGIDSLDSKPSNIDPTIDVSIEPKFVKTSVDLENERTCLPEMQPNFFDGSKCDCVKLVCQAPQQVKVGDTTKIKPFGEEIRVTEDDVCASCTDIIFDGITGEDFCVQYESLRCPDGYVERIDGTEIVCVKLVDKVEVCA